MLIQNATKLPSVNAEVPKFVGHVGEIVYIRLNFHFNITAAFWDKELPSEEVPSQS